jgi:GNAT superfamily N-acetyltransferase
MRKFIISLLFIGNSCFAQDDPLKNTEFKAIIKGFAHARANKYESISKPEGLELKTPIYLCFDGANSIKAKSKILERTTTFLIKVPVDYLGLKSKKASKSLKDKEIGKVILIENSHNPGINGKFTLHFIGINKKYQGKGFGSTALDLVILFAQQLANKSTFYNRLTLQCADYDGKKHLGDDPHRLRYYLNHGFHIDPITLNYLPFLDMRYFLFSLDVDRFTSYLKDNDPNETEDGSSSIVNNYIHYAEPILYLLKEQYQHAAPIKDDSLIQIAESDSSKAATRVLERVLHGGRLTPAQLALSCEQVYLMHLDVMNWSEAINTRRQLLAIRKKDESMVFNISEENDLLSQIDKAYHSIVNRPIAPTFKIVTKSDNDQLRSKIRKAVSDETLAEFEINPNALEQLE